MSLTHTTTCLLCDPQRPKRFTAPAMPEVPPGEQKPPEAVGIFVQALGMHVNKAHNETFQSIYRLGAMFQALLLMENFSSSDPGLETATNQVRHFIHKRTQADPAWSRDEWLRGFYDSLIEDSPEGVIRFEELKRFRDLVMEEGQPAAPAPRSLRVPPRIVTA